MGVLQVDFCSPLPSVQNGSSILHFATEQEDNTSLHIVDFLVSNSQHVVQKDQDGNTPLHVAARYGKLNCLKLLLLKTTGEFNFQNTEAKTPKDIAKENSFEDIVDLLSESKHKRIEISMEFNDIDWGLPAPGTEGLYEVPISLRPDQEEKDQIPDRVTQSGVFGHEHLFSGSLEPGEETPPIPPRRSFGMKSGNGGISASDLELLEPLNKDDIPPVPPRPESHQAFLVRALYECDADYTDELSFTFGDNIVVTQILDEDWWRGFLISNRNTVGVFPSCYVEKVEGNKIPSTT